MAAEKECLAAAGRQGGGKKHNEEEECNALHDLQQ